MSDFQTQRRWVAQRDGYHGEGDEPHPTLREFFGWVDSEQPPELLDRLLKSYPSMGVCLRLTDTEQRLTFDSGDYLRDEYRPWIWVRE